MHEVWKSVLGFLKNTIPEEVFVPWFGKVEFTEDSEPDIINIRVPSVPHSKFIKAQYEKDIEEKASEICGREIKLKITVKDPNKGAMISEPLALPILSRKRKKPLSPLMKLRPSAVFTPV